MLWAFQMDSLTNILELYIMMYSSYIEIVGNLAMKCLVQFNLLLGSDIPILIESINPFRFFRKAHICDKIRTFNLILHILKQFTSLQSYLIVQQIAVFVPTFEEV